ncbi:MAG: 16S rRNA (cytosine(967)-C(5))-methyltransferase RsmB [Firmicutes bacterium]|nr:16S rRNA (cytosine(967)-C(5))-methyltransferase RsmB [[Eubacterium] siraeum]MCM1488940.1 16S rRNA (cytosine(967)-C(5))-methyltransferase RsmB [Bacillota bacterium]
MKSARQVVLELLIKMQENGAYSNIVLDNTFSREKLSNRDRAFAAMLFYGVIERRMTLDYIIRQYSSAEFDNIDTDVLQLLRMGLYQLMYTGVPENAAVNESVNLASQSRKGFINGILRSFIREGKQIDYKELTGAAKMSIEYSCPKWLIKKWIEMFGEETAVEILKDSFGRPPLFVKVNTLKITPDQLIAQLAKEKIEAKKNALLDDCLELGRIRQIEASKAFCKGFFHVQDISSQLCCRIAKPIFNETVVDVCAAPGGKTFTMAEMMANRGKIYSYDLYDGKVSMISQGAERLGLTIVNADVQDATVYNPNIPMADKVLCDTVCSGLGVIRRKPEIKYKEMKNLEQLPIVQKHIMQTASRYVKPGGTLIYSTCTLNPEENEDVVKAFLAENRSFTPVVVPIGISGVEELSMRTFLPSVTGGDGFFAATLRRVR